MTRRSMWYVIIAAGVAGCFILLVAVLGKVSDQADAAKDASESNHEAVLASQRAASAAEANTAQIQDCLHPGGTCYRAARHQHQVDRWVLILGTACANGYSDLPTRERIAKTQHCVTSRLGGITDLGPPPRR